MRITDIGVGGYYELDSTKGRGANARTPADATGTRSADTIELSHEALRQLELLQLQPPGREQQIEQLTQLYDAGQLSVDSEALSDALIEKAFNW